MKFFKLLTETFRGNEPLPVSSQELTSIINNVPSGKSDRIIGIEIYKDIIAIALEKENPIIGLMYESFPLGMNILPEEGDELIFVKEGNCVPIVYDKTANAYLYSESSDLLINEFTKLVDDFANISRLRERLKVQYEPNLFKRIVGNLYENELSKFFVKIKSPVLIFKMFSFIKFILNFKNQQNTYLKDINLEGIIKSINLFSFKTKHKNGTTTTTYIIPMRLYYEPLNIFLSAIYRKTPMLTKKIDLPPTSSKIKIIGKIHTKEKHIIAENVLFGKHKII